MIRLVVLVWIWLVSTPLVASTALQIDEASCRKDPFDRRTLYLRGTFNSWNAVESQKFIWACSQYQLVTVLEGDHRFKVGDESWSADADFGARDKTPELVRRGVEIQHRFTGTHRVTFAMDPDKEPHTLQIENCPLPAPFGKTTLYLRGTMNNWAALDLFAFQYSCDGYYLNVNLSTPHEFKIADAAMNELTTFGRSPEGTLVVGGTGNLSHPFGGEQTVKLTFDHGKPKLAVGPKTFADPISIGVADPVALSMHFDSRARDNKSPFGAVVAGTTVRFGMAARKGIDKVTLVVERRRLEGNQEILEYTEVARIPMVRSEQGRLERWEASYLFGDVSVYGYWFDAEIGGRKFVYQNNLDPIFWTREKGSGGLGRVDDSAATTKNIRRFRQTVYTADFKVPEWAPDIVFYYIFPDRFRNGDRGNDPAPGLSRYHNSTVEMHKNWNELPFLPGSGDGSDDVYNNDFFGGDLAGIIEKLDYIKELGANTIYMTPVFQGASNHKYDTADYRNIDPAFGTNDDFVRLAREAARRGIRIIVDTSLNHTGADSIYFDRFGNYRSGGAFAGGKIRADSPFSDWYTFDPSQTDPDKQYKGWTGVTDLPELNKASPAFRKFAYGADDSVMKRWLDRGAAGWRMDVAPWVPDDFWREWRKAIKQHAPDALTVAETWFDASKYFLGDMFDSTMNYIFRSTVLEYAAGGKASSLYSNIEQMREAYPPQAFYALMNLLSSHDQARALHVLGWNAISNDAERVALAKSRLKLAMLFQMTFPGAPAVYYGDEVGVTGGDDPYNRAPYPWADQGGAPDHDLHAEVRRLIRLRHDNPVLRRGSMGAPLYIDDHVIVLSRQLSGVQAITAFNNALEHRRVSIQLPEWTSNVSLTDAWTGAITDARDGKLTVDIPALSGIILLSQ